MPYWRVCTAASPWGTALQSQDVAADLIACDGPVCDVERPLGDKNVTEVLNINI